MKRRLITTAALIVGAAACTGEGSSDRQEAFDTLTRRQRDSLAAALPVPGAKSVLKALDALDASQERAARHDSLAAGAGGN